MLVNSRLRPFLFFFTWLLFSQLCSARQAPVNDYAKVAGDFKALLDRPYVKPVAVFTRSETDGLIIEKGAINTEPGEQVPVVIYKPAAVSGRLPVVICHHGTGASKDQADIKNFLLRFSKLGFMAVAIDARFHGERIPGGAHGKQEYEQAVIAAWQNKDPAKQTHPFFFDTVYDSWRLVDYLVSRPDVDPQRIGMTGISMGGIETWMAAATDTRIKVVVPIIAAQSFKWSLENDRWQGRAGTIQAAHNEVAKETGDAAPNQKNVAALWAKLVPGITGEFDCPSMVRLIAPRPMLVLSTENDQNCPLPGALIAYESATQAYKAKNASDKLKMDVAPGQPHRLVPAQADMAVEWFRKWL